MVGWLRAYTAALHEAPTVWGLHDYYDTTYFRTSGLQDMLATVHGDVWLTETGGIVELRGRDGAVTLPYDEARARASVGLAIETAKAFSARVKRIYLYQWKADPADRFDAGLLRADGRARPALAVVQQQLGRGAGAPAGAAPGAGSAGTAAPARPAVPGRILVHPTGGSRIGVRCSAPPRSACAGRLWLEGARFANGILVNGLPADDVLRPLALRFSLRPGRHADLRFRIPAAVIARAQARGVLRLRLAVTSPEAPFALQARYVAAALPVHARPRAHRAKRR
jgi:hypothetical protein